MRPGVLERGFDQALSRVDSGTANTYVPNKTISVPGDVVRDIESLDIPFSRWMTDQIRRNAAQSTVSFAQQLAADAALASGERRLTKKTLLRPVGAV